MQLHVTFALLLNTLTPHYCEESPQLVVNIQGTPGLLRMR